jgi:2,3-bisphosphoglycerate-independent phosphoglycerate mutase
MKKVLLIIRDGWGYRLSRNQNAINEVNPPYTNYLMKNYPHTLLNASGNAVGLPKGYQGNSEVGHMAIGSGRLIFQSLPRIDKSIKTKEFFKNPVFLKAVRNCKKNNSTMHIIGLLQSEGVHGDENHLYALLKLCENNNLHKVNVHVITDGRDAPVHNAVKHVKKLIQKIKQFKEGKISTISGRFYAMDRDKRWARTKKAYDCIVNAKASSFKDPIVALNKSYKNQETDEFIIPKKHKDYKGIKPKDSVIFYNFRTDRTRQLTKAMVERNFQGWKRNPLDITFVAMTQFYEPLNAGVAFKELNVKNNLGEVISKAGLKQLRISETEKYAHVTFFFNSQEDNPYKKEDRILIHSPHVRTYDLKPEMSALKIKNRLIKEISSDKYSLIVVNLVNGDMVGHTGIKKACHEAVKTVDNCLKEIIPIALEHDYNSIIFADHGNVEDQTLKWRTSHTINPVPCILVSKEKHILKPNKGLKDIAPTVLKLLNIKMPKEMTGQPLF